MRKFYFIVLAVIFGLIAVSHVFAQEGSTSTDTQKSATDCIGGPSGTDCMSQLKSSLIEITSPKEGDLITGDEILLNIKYSGESGNHAHIWLDEPSPTGDNAKTLENSGPFLFRDVKPGDHTIIVELAEESHKSVDSAQKITLKVKTRSAADVTQEEIAKALSQVKPAEMENSNNNQNAVAAPQNQTDKSSVKSSFTIWMISGVIIIVIAIGAIFFILRRKKQE